MTSFYSTKVYADCKLFVEGGDFDFGEITVPVRTQPGTILKTQTKNYIISCAQPYDIGNEKLGCLFYYPQYAPRGVGLSGIDINVYFIDGEKETLISTPSTNWDNLVRLSCYTRDELLATPLKNFVYKMRVDIVRNPRPLRSGDIVQLVDRPGVFTTGQFTIRFPPQTIIYSNIVVGKFPIPFFVYGSIKATGEACLVNAPRRINLPTLTMREHENAPLNSILNETAFSVSITCPQKANINILFQDVHDGLNKTENLFRNINSTAQGFAFTLRYNNAPVFMTPISVDYKSFGTVISKSVEQNVPVIIPLSIAYKKTSAKGRPGILISRVQVMVIYQ